MNVPKNPDTENAAPLPDKMLTSSTPSGAPERLIRYDYGGILLVCLFAFFWRLGSVPLFDLDEALYVTCARQMVVSGDVVTPRLNSRPLDRPAETSVPFYEKPILVYWLSAATQRLFGFREWAARLPVALLSLLTTFLVALAGQRWFGRRAGLLAGLVYATTPMTIADARQMTTDALLVLWFALALLAFWGCYRDVGGEQSIQETTPSGGRATWRWPLLFWTALAFAVLTKGAVGALLPFLALGVFLLLNHFGARLRPGADWKQALGSLRPIVGIPLFLALVAPWHLLIWQAGGHDAQGRTWIQEYIFRQHIGRFQGLDAVHNLPLFANLIYFLVGFFPWSCFATAAFRFAPGKPRARLRGVRPTEETPNPSLPAHDETHRFLLVWFWTIFAFFSLGAAKLPTYIVPAYPAAALLVGRWLDRALATTATAKSQMSRSLRRGALAATLTALALLAVALTVTRLLPVLAPRLDPHYNAAQSPIPPDMLRVALHLALLLLVGSLTALLCFLRGESVARWRQIGVGALVAMMLGLVGLVSTEGYALATRDVLAPYQSLATAANAAAEAGMPVFYYHIVPRRPSMLYYARYSPLETNVVPFLPFLRDHLSSHSPECAVITSRANYEKLVLPEITAASDASARIITQTTTPGGGWILFHIRFRPLPSKIPR